MIQDVLLVLHVTGGTLALVGALVAGLVQAARRSHRVHVIAGRTFVVGMGLVVVSAVPLSIMVSSVLLGLIAVFSAYLTITGWRFALNRRGVPTPLDWAVPVVMGAASLAMLGYGALTVTGSGVILIVFGAVGGALVVLHLHRLRTGAVRGRLRIASHLIWMLSASIAAVTAFLVVNGRLGLLDWFLPTIVVTPVIVVWARRIRAGAATSLDRPRASSAPDR